MYSGISLLLVVLAAAVPAIYAQGNDNCVQVLNGNQKGVAFEERLVPLSAGNRDWTITIPIPPECKHVNGVLSVLCDYDVKPDAYYQDQTHLIVHRNGDVAGNGSVKPTVYCDIY